VRFEKRALVPASPAEVWRLLLDTQAMMACVPGVEKIEPLSDTEFVVAMHVKMSFISARFRVRTAIVEARPPAYLRSEGAGEDATLTSSLKLKSEVFLSAQDEQTEIRLLLEVELFGRLGTFGLSAVKTKAERMWEEFGRNLAAKVAA
jgi:uncharacterized protein